MVMMPFRCEQCSKEFSSDESLQHHNADKHGAAMSRHDLKQLKRGEKEKQRRDESDKEGKSKRMKSILFYGGIGGGFMLVVALFIFFTSSGPKPEYDLTGFPSRFIHWHADVDVVLCGEEQKLPEAAAGRMLGTPQLHTHDQSANSASMAESDGNGVIHTEGTVRANPAEHTLGRFMGNIGVKFSETEIMSYQNGDACANGTAGTVTVTANNQTLSNPPAYLPRDKDYIIIRFG